MTPLVALSVAGSDSGGAAGVAADLATFADLGAHGAMVITAVTAQDTTGVHDVHRIPPASIRAQLDAVFGDLPVAVLKAGMLGSPEVAALVAAQAARVPLVVDPVLVSTSGAALGGEEMVAAYRELLMPVATVITPNLEEARSLAGGDGPPEDLAAELAALGPAVVLTGGPPVGGAPGDCVDWLAVSGRSPVPLGHPQLPTSNDHGTGCTFSAALAVHLARGAPHPEAVRRAASYTTGQLRRSLSWHLGRGRGPIAHLSNPTGGAR